jgi:hypothetical protein
MPTTFARAPSQRLAQDAATTTDIEHAGAFQRNALRDVVQPHGIQVVQRPRFSIDVPPARGQLVELGGFGGMNVRHVVLHST